MYAEVWEADLGRNIFFYWDAFAETVTTLRGKSAATFAHVFCNLFDETKDKDSLRQSIFMKLFDFKKLS